MAKLAARNVTALAMDSVPRILARSSRWTAGARWANIAGLTARSSLAHESSAAFLHRLVITAAGVPPAGRISAPAYAGLAAIALRAAWKYQKRAFDTRLK